jgi:hypothetical protein
LKPSPCKLFPVCLVGVGAVWGCATPAGAPQPPAVPKGTPVDVATASSTLVWRKAPVPFQGARHTVRQFFDAIAREAGPELEALFTDDALFHRPNQPATPAAIAWHRRLSAGDYTHQSVPGDIPIQLLDQAASVELAGHRDVKLQPEAGEVLAVVLLPTMPPPLAGLWGTQLQLVLAPRQDGWRIREAWEDYVTR